MGLREVPTSFALHPELRHERTDCYRWAESPEAAIILQVSPLTPVRMAVIGVADVTQCLHSLTVVESSTEVLLRAFVGDNPRSGRSREFDYIVRRVFWVAEVELDSPLGTRAVMMDALPAARPGDDDRLPIHGRNAP